MSELRIGFVKVTAKTTKESCGLEYLGWFNGVHILFPYTFDKDGIEIIQDNDTVIVYKMFADGKRHAILPILSVVNTPCSLIEDSELKAMHDMQTLRQVAQSIKKARKHNE